MIVIRVELWPGGNHAVRKTIGVGVIANTGGTEARGEYEARFYGAGNSKSGDISGVYDDIAKGPLRGMMRSSWRAGRIVNFPRKVYGVWVLLNAALRASLRENERH